ncbi:putative exopolysaccharide biosynthesis protein YwqD [Desulfosarcina cetonica]|uniref:CpsD/CapB family tyrosine-protein kinase n=1 Tax=Desulfosarcina cetonica TaxID=90730 RepID=UPI0009F8EE5D|nr:CpsD/CapB family tyrosine-protein kinase [Desulfosarcina cetonica]VTR64109.1 putative exopolysaccharide biosynthesis protein YwqD [Desulfosarcina cetonica]
MGKIHEALEKSSLEKGSRRIHPVELKPFPNREQTSDIKPVTPKTEVRTPSALSKWRIDQNLITYHDPSGVEAEIFKILRTNILFPKKGKPPRSIMVTSAVPGDGKSFVAANLAVSIAQGVEEHVLLIDCDMRRPTIHTQFGFDDDVPGLNEYLSKKQPLESLLQKTIVDKLTILPGGGQARNPAELLSSQAMKELLEETKHRYSDRYVIIDTPPPQLTAETTALANYIDGIILVVRYASTPKELVKELLLKFGKDKVIGVVMNGYRVPTTERYGYGKYKKYKKY